MKFSTNIISQATLASAQGLNLTLWSNRIQIVISILLALVQAVVAAKAHWSNPDGSRAQLPYVGDDRI